MRGDDDYDDDDDDGDGGAFQRLPQLRIGTVTTVPIQYVYVNARCSQSFLGISDK